MCDTWPFIFRGLGCMRKSAERDEKLRNNKRSVLIKNNEGFLTYIPLSPQNQIAGVTSENVARRRNVIDYHGH